MVHYLHGGALAATWMAVGVSSLVLALSVILLAGGQKLTGCLNKGNLSVRYRWGMVLFGLFGVIETVPRLIGASAGALLTISTLAFIPMLGAVGLMLSGRTETT